MIPVRLRLEGFLSYRTATEIDLAGHDVVCLTGANGQGKSAILDAITWALFGAARGSEGGQQQDRLISDGADRATVELDLELNGSIYRIVRSRTAKGGDLRFTVRSGEGWTNLAGDTLRETEARIGGVVRMDHRTFTASAFLLQGRADDFLTRMKPEERKDVFARLLDLGTYERLADAARASAREAEGRRKELGERVEALTGQVRVLPGLRHELASADEAVRTAEAAVASAERELQARRDELARLETTLAVASGERAAAEATQRRLEADRAAAGARCAELGRIDELAARLPDVEAALAEAGSLAATDLSLHETARARAELQTRLAEVRGEIEAERTAISSRRSQRAADADRLSKELRSIETERPRLDELETLLAESAAVAATIEELRGQREELLAEHKRLEQALIDLDRRERERTEKLELLEAGESSCPVCSGPLDAAHRRKLVRDLKADGAALVEERRTTVSRQADVKKEGLRVREDVERLAKVVATREQLVASASALRERLDGAGALAERLATLRAEDAADAEVLSSGSYAVEARGELASLEGSLEGLAYDREEHERVRRRLAELAEQRDLAGRISEAVARRDAVAAELDELRARIGMDERELARHAEALEALAGVLAAEPEVRMRVADASAACDRAAADGTAAAVAAAKLAERVQATEALQAELDSARAAEQAAADGKRRYQRLTQAFGRGGIPDLIIENALPELTQDANEILGRLTDHEMSLQFLMGRPTRTGKAKETFDVVVHHDGGARDYQLFSGGEAFRIAFAIRLALSRLLVRRAGARLETLVIDEGFGTQDAEGRERLVEAINLARREFRRIIVITHLDELKDAFPTQVRVSKDPLRGSSVQIVSA